MLTKKTIRIMLLDDHPYILHGLKACLSEHADIQILGTFVSSQELLAALHLHSADLVLLDYSLGPNEVDGLNMIRSLKVRFPSVRLLVISAMHNPSTVSMVMRCGVDGFIGKEVDPDQLSIAIHQVASGKQYLTETMKELIYENETVIDNQPISQVNDTSTVEKLVQISVLTAREYEVLRCCLDGMSVTKIAEKFSRSVKTISTQKQSAFKKLGIQSDHELYKIRDQLQTR